MTTPQSGVKRSDSSAVKGGSKARMEQVIDRAATGLGDSIGFLAESGALFVVFAFMWVAFGAALVWSQGSLDAAWQWIRDLPWLAQGAVWVLFLPVVLGLWIWETSWSLIVRLMSVLGIAGWNLLVFPKPWK